MRRLKKLLKRHKKGGELKIYFLCLQFLQDVYFNIQSFFSGEFFLWLVLGSQMQTTQKTLRF